MIDGSSGTVSKRSNKPISSTLSSKSKTFKSDDMCRTFSVVVVNEWPSCRTHRKATCALVLPCALPIVLSVSSRNKLPTPLPCASGLYACTRILCCVLKLIKPSGSEPGMPA